MFEDDPRAGIIPYCIDEDEIFVCLFTSNDPKFGGPDPAIAKGGVEGGETLLEAAIRETNEETGISIEELRNAVYLTSKIVRGLNSEYELHVFASEVSSMGILFPTHEGHGKWYHVDDASKHIRKTHKPFLDILLNKLNNCKNKSILRD